MKTARLGAALVIAGIGIFLIVPNAQAQLFCVVIIGTALGLINTSILMPYVFILNNTEKIYAVVGSNVLINLISLFQGGNAGNYLKHGGDLWLSFTMLAVALSAIIFFKANNLPATSETSDIDTPIFHSRIFTVYYDRGCF